MSNRSNTRRNQPHHTRHTVKNRASNHDPVDNNSTNYNNIRLNPPPLWNWIVLQRKVKDLRYYYKNHERILAVQMVQRREDPEFQERQRVKEEVAAAAQAEKEAHPAARSAATPPARLRQRTFLGMVREKSRQCMGVKGIKCMRTKI